MWLLTKQQVEIADHVIPLCSGILAYLVGQLSQAFPLTTSINGLKDQSYHALKHNTAVSEKHICMNMF